jgi:2,4-dienoyl-CoA reductase-like NADH-dependent reductase (Old Yellow Enzyme family)
MSNRHPTAGFTDIPENDVELPAGFDREKAKIFTPLQVGPFLLNHRIVHSALGRSRSAHGIESPHAAEYFRQRTTPGSLIISQATSVSLECIPWPWSVALHTPTQIQALSRTIAAVHEKGGIWFQQMFHPGRTTSPSLVKRAWEKAGHLEPPKYGYQPVSSSDVGESGINTHSGEPFGQPRPLTLEEIKELRGAYKSTAEKAVLAGADGIEVLAGNGFLLDQFLHDNINHRTDQYGGSIENRARLILEIIDDIADVVGHDRIGIRVSPFSK